MTDTKGPRLPLLVALKVRKLLGHSAIYGSADVFGNLTNFLLVPLYTTYLTAADYGTLGILFFFSTVAKVLFRMGLDAGFFRIYYDLKTEDERRKFAGTVALFSIGAGAALFGAVVLCVPILAQLLLGAHARSARLLVILAAADVYVGTFAFIPLNLLRIQDRAALFSTVSSLRQAANTILKVVLVMRGLGVVGCLWSDVLSTALFSLVLVPVTLKNVSWGFSVGRLKEALAFGLPKVPHGFMIQFQNFADRKILDLFTNRSQVGIYQMGYTFGMGVKFATSAFEPAWQPFVFSQVGKPNARVIIARVVTYAWAAFATVALLVSVFGGEALRLMARRPAFWAGAAVIPVVALAYALHGAFLLTSLGIAVEKKARYYPLVTLASAATNLVCNLLLIPRFGMVGAAWATVASYAVMAGAGFVISHRLYPIPFEWGRLATVSGAAALTYGLSLFSPTGLVEALAVKAGLVLVFPAILLASGVLAEAERDWLRQRWRSRRA